MLNIKNVRAVADLTGRHLTSRWDVVGTDCGAMVYSPKYHRLYVLFGDTYGADPKDPLKETNWRGSVAGYTTDFDVSRGIRWDSFLLDDQGRAKEIIKKHMSPNDECFENTKICQGGIEIDGTLYFTYESIRHWGTAGRWDANFCGVLKSTDGGETLEKVRDLSWVEPEDPALWPMVKDLVDESMDLTPEADGFDVESHIAPGFASIVFSAGKDGYIYGYGRYSGRFHGIHICRVKKKDFECFNAYEYLVRYEEDGTPVWLKGQAGLEAIRRDFDATEAVLPPMSNLSVIYNCYLDKWLLMYHYPEKGIFCRESETPYGPFGQEQMIFDESHPDLTDGISVETDGNRLYSCYTHEVICREQGRIIPVLISQWYQWPGQPRYYASRLFEIELV